VAGVKEAYQEGGAGKGRVAKCKSGGCAAPV